MINFVSKWYVTHRKNLADGGVFSILFAFGE